MMKARLVGSALGSGLFQMRNWWDLRSIKFRNPERASVIGNAIIADALIARLSRPGQAFLDIGAHIGSVLAAVHRRDPSIDIHAIEADADKAKRLKDKFTFCTLQTVAVGEENGTATFFLDRDRPGYNSLARQVGHVAQVEVEVRTLDTLYPENAFDVIKIDIEGAELGALRGGTKLLQRARPTIMFESARVETNALGFSPEALWQFLDESGYDVLSPDRLAHTAPPMDLSCFLDSHYYPRRTQNYFAVARERRDEIRKRSYAILAPG